MEHVFYTSGDGHVRELYFNGVWHGIDLTVTTNGPLVYGTSLSGFFDGHIDRAFYLSYYDGHVRELYFNGAWPVMT
jgi:hypothetical protein